MRQEWAKLRDRNEALDCAVLARAALWLLGADRLLCGDSTDAATVARAMESDHAAMLFTLPPS